MYTLRWHYDWSAVALFLSRGCAIVIFFLFELHLSNGNYEAVLCEDEISLNISCDDDYVIEIKDVEFGPPASLNNSLFDSEIQQINVTYLHALCNERHFCIIENTENNNVDGYTHVPRLANMSFKCDFEYIGCYKVDQERLKNTISSSNTNNMSALVCRHICLKERIHFTHFGTKGSACYCGSASLFQPYKTIGSNIWHNSSDCNASCNGNEYEKCGANDLSLVSIYTAETDNRNVLTSVDQIEILKCDFNSTYTNFTGLSVEVSKYCETPNMNDSERLRCDGDSCFLDLPMSKVPDNRKKPLPYYVKIRYLCNGSKEKINTLDNNVIAVVVGAVVGVGVIFGAVFGLCMFRRKLQRNESNEICSLQNQETSLRSGENVNLQMSENNLNNERSSENNEYSVVLKITPKHSNQDEESPQSSLSASEDVYIDSVEGVYDVAHKPKYKVKTTSDNPIYSHTPDSVYDSADRNEPDMAKENIYDHGFHQQKGNDCNM